MAWIGGGVIVCGTIWHGWVVDDEMRDDYYYQRGVVFGLAGHSVAFSLRFAGMGCEGVVSLIAWLAWFGSLGF